MIDWQGYLKDSSRTAAGTQHPIDQYITHGAIGISGEAGEILDTVKKSMFYGQPLDIVNIREELGDLMWYVAMLCRALDVDLQEILNENIAKLVKRYPDKFTEELAKERRDKGGHTFW